MTLMVLGSRTLRGGVTVVAILLFGGSITEAQGTGDSLEHLHRRVATGDTVTVTDASGHETQGTIVAISTSSLALLAGKNRMEFGDADVETISRRDPRWNGTLWGIGAGGVLGTLVDRSLVNEYGRDDISRGASAAFIATAVGIGAGIGFVVDALIRGQQVIYSKPRTTTRILPIWGIQRKGISLSLRFS